MSLPPVPADVFFSYNGQTFNSTVRTKVRERPITSGDDRTVKFSELTISAVGYITADESTTYALTSYASTNGGAGYTVGDVLTLSGGTLGIGGGPVTISVVAVDGGGAITTSAVETHGTYSAVPSNPCSFTGGTGTGFAANITWAATLNTLDVYMLALRRKLQVNGKNLKYVNKGYGLDLNINGVIGDSIRDCNMGPKPGTFTWWPMGGAPHGCHAAGFEWEITTWIAECGSFNPEPGIFSEISFSVSYETDEAGLVVITYHGNAQIPLSLRSDGNGAPTLDRNIDEFFLNVFRPVPVGFLRRMTRQVSSSRASCSFTITDRQIEVPYPKDVVVIDMKHRIRQDRPLGVLWNCTITGTVRMSPSAPKYLAWARFFAIVVQRIAFIRNHPTVVNPFPTGNADREITPTVPITGPIEMEEDLFKNESRFTISFKLIGVPFHAIVQMSGLWRPVVNAPPIANNIPNARWTAVGWNRSLANNAQQNGGILQARFNTADDVIIDVCNNRVRDGSVPRDPRIQVSPDQMNDDSQQVDDEDLKPLEPSEILRPDKAAISDLFPPESSWVAWECTVDRIVDHNRVRHKPTTGNVTYTPPKIDPFGQVQPLAADATDPEPDWRTDAQDVIQQVAMPSLTVVVRGYGVRVAYRVNAPKLLTYAGREVSLLHEQISETTLAMAAGITVYRSAWELTYAVTGGSDVIPVMANPFLGTDGIGGSGSSAAAGS